MKRRYDIGRRKFQGEPGDLVLLSVKSHPDFGAARKLRMRYTGPYPIKRKVHDNAFELEGLPPTVPPTQNVEYLRLFVPSPDKFATRPQPAKAAGPLKVGDHLEWEVESITGDELVNGQRRYWVRWKDHDKPDLLRLSQLKHCAEMLRDYQQSKGIALDFWTESSSSMESQSGEDSDQDLSGSEDQGHTPPRPSTTDPTPPSRVTRKRKEDTLLDNCDADDEAEEMQDNEAHEERKDQHPGNTSMDPGITSLPPNSTNKEGQTNSETNQTFDWGEDESE